MEYKEAKKLFKEHKVKSTYKLTPMQYIALQRDAETMNLNDVEELIGVLMWIEIDRITQRFKEDLSLETLKDYSFHYREKWEEHLKAVENWERCDKYKSTLNDDDEIPF